ncbi:WXG100-like domain-containing protein [Actinoalloteichus hymeniacidonis]|uniref:Outer membrane channel protein CpnT-like N-terminal domain-containing protein n=1 Tax=Actinoalloteichus hymeniacidonis TaxID=340345 RepID=A0AAC9HTA1_9PSEU|nr:hypothetical protein [Actinoalloteichus hymeniacidonis]AOS64944.1 hypothetical protein TL08_20765 [Actinoalloteichus hymeniacidonis]MBB5906981.1 hypothetical protein [Actinoalloteichus hymeniacidonis]
MGMELPESLQWVASIALGADWPESDEDKLREMRDAWETAGTDITAVKETAQAAAQSAAATMQGETAEQFQTYWEEFEGYLVAFSEMSQQLSTGCGDMALEVEHAKISIYIALAALAVQIIALLAAAAASLGTASAGIPVAQAATQVVVRQILQKLIQNILLNIATNLATDYGIQAFQMARGDRSGLDHGNFGNHIVNGVIQGAGQTVGGAVTSAIPTGASRGMGGAALRGAGAGAVGGFAQGVTEFTAQGGVSSLTGGEYGSGWDYRNLTSNTISGTIGGAQGNMSDRTQGLAESTFPNQTTEHSTPRNNPSHAREVLDSGRNWPVGGRAPEGFENPYNSGTREQVGINGSNVIDQAGRHRPQNQGDDSPLPEARE